MSSTEHVSVAKYAVEVWDDYDFKREVFCASGSDYDRSTENLDKYGRKQLWNETVQKKAALILKNSSFPETVQKQIEEVAIPIGMKMLTWAVYHESAVGFSREYSINSFKSSFFTEEGIIDSKTAAEELMKDESLNVKQKYKLACLYCFEEYIYDLYEQINKEGMKIFHLSQSGLAEFWSYYLMGKIDNLRGEKTVDEYRLEMAIQNGSKATVEYCLSKTTLKDDAIVNAAVDTVRNSIVRNDWVVFEDGTHYDNSWVPKDYYVDVLRFLLSKMTGVEKKEFLEKDIKTDYGESSYEYSNRSRVLEYFLKWPYQVHFMKTAGLMWEFLPEYNYAVLLLKISDKIEPTNEENIECGEEKCFDYRGLLQEFWKESPKRCKRYVINDEEVTYEAEGVITVKTCTGLLINFLTSLCGNLQYNECIRSILSQASDMEIYYILTNDKMINELCGLMRKEKWGVLDAFVVNCFSSIEQAGVFKNALIFSEGTQRVVTDFLGSKNCNAVESFSKWSTMSEEKLNYFKREIAFTRYIEGMFWHMIRNETNMQQADEILKWCLASDEKVKNRKEQIAYSGLTKHLCEDFVPREETKPLDKFINWCLSSQEEIKKCKNSLANSMSFICDILMSIYPTQNSKFEGGKWGRVDNILDWFMFTEEEKRAFKKNQIFKKWGSDIYLATMESDRHEAETLFKWFDLSAEEIEELKRETFHY